MEAEKYWENRYSLGGNSGAGSYGNLAAFKADTINNFIESNNINSVIEFGCGDGNQLKLLAAPKYVGYDVSKSAVANCKSLFQSDKSKRFVNTLSEIKSKADLTLSLDVIYHLIDDEVYHDYMSNLFDYSKKYVIIYSNDQHDNGKFASHIKCHKFTEWVKEHRPEFELTLHLPNKYPYNPNNPKGTSISDFYFYKRI